MRGLVRILAVAGLLWFRTAPSLQGQSVTATLVGTVTDQSGAAVPGAALALTAIGTNVKRMVVTSENGDFTIPGLAPGTYQLVASHQGFKQTVVERVELLVNQTARVDVVLQVGAVAESVEVTGVNPLVASETSSVGQVFKIQMNSYSAEFGRYAVQVNATTKSGTNSFHGTVHEFFRNDDLDAANFFTNFAGLKKAPLRYNLFGGAAGGRILRNRTP